MPSPFPGMDPYLENEDHWSTFQPLLVHAVHQLLQPGLLDRYRARVGERQYTSEQILFTSISREEHEESFIEVRQRSDGRLITLIEAVSPANKTTAEGRKVYCERRDEAKRMSVNLVEIDLILQGTPLIEYAQDSVPTWDYAVVVTRWTQPDRCEIYSTTLAKRLPRFRLPLASDDRDTVFDLQAAVARAYEQGGFSGRIDYAKTPQARLSDENRKWMNDLLKQDNQGK